MHNINNNKVFITGISGFIGSNLEKYLSEDYIVQGVSRNINQITIGYNDLNDEALNNSKAIIHLAGKAHDIKGKVNESEYYEVNTDLTIKLFDSFLRSSCEIFVFVSSVKAVADEVSGELLEETLPNPISIYGKSKLKAEKHILKNTPVHKRVYILRPSMVHGPNNKGNLNLLYSLVSKGIPYPFGSYNNERSFLSVSNFNYVIKKLIDNKVASGVYNIADDEPLSTKEIVNIIGNIAGRKGYILNIPKVLVELIGKIGDVFPFPLSSDKIKKITGNYIVSNKKIKEVLKIQQLPLSAKEGIEKTIKSFTNTK